MINHGRHRVRLKFSWLPHGQWVTIKKVQAAQNGIGMDNKIILMGSIGHVLKYGQVMFICYMAYCPVHFRCAKDVYDFLYGSRMFTAVGGLVHPRKLTFYPQVNVYSLLLNMAIIYI